MAAEQAQAPTLHRLETAAVASQPLLLTAAGEEEEGRHRHRVDTLLKETVDMERAADFHTTSAAARALASMLL